MAATGHKSYNRNIFGNKRYRNLDSESFYCYFDERIENEGISAKNA